MILTFVTAATQLHAHAAHQAKLCDGANSARDSQGGFRVTASTATCPPRRAAAVSQRKKTLAEPPATVSGAQREASPAQQMCAPSRDALVFSTHSWTNVRRSWNIRLVDGGDICVLAVNSSPCKQPTGQEQLTPAHGVQQYRATKSARRATVNPGSPLSSPL